MDPLLEKLQRNPLIPREELALTLNVPLEEVNSRIATYEKDGTIVGYQAILDFERLGNGDVTAVIEVRITPEREGGFNRIADRIAKFDQVQGCYLMSGGYDLLVVIDGKNLRDVARFVTEKLSTLEGVLSTATHFRLKTYKENGVLLKNEEAIERLSVSP